MTFGYNVNLNKKQIANFEEQKCYSDYTEYDCNQNINVFEDEDINYQNNSNLEAVLNLFEECEAEYDAEEAGIIYDYQEYAKRQFDAECSNVNLSLDDALDTVGIDDLRQNLASIEFEGDLDEAMAKLDTVKIALSERIKTQAKGIATTYYPNGKFDMPSLQGEVGDCWLISGANSLLTTEKGKKILTDSITVDDGNQTVTVNLAGVGKTYEIPIDELYNNIENAAGDMDMRALEVAIEKYGLEEGIATNTYFSNGDIEFDESYDLEGNYSRTAFNLLVPKEERDTKTTFNYNGDVSKKLDEIMNNKKNTAACISIMDSDNEFSVKKSAISGSFFGRFKQDKKEAKAFMSNLSKDNTTIYSKHAYSIVKVTKDSVYLVNPWYTDEKIKVPREKLESIASLRLETQTFND